MTDEYIFGQSRGLWRNKHLGVTLDSSLIRCRLLVGGELRFFLSKFWD